VAVNPMSLVNDLTAPSEKVADGDDVVFDLTEQLRSEHQAIPPGRRMLALIRVRIVSLPDEQKGVTDHEDPSFYIGVERD
jgi:hypothetical protein